jgi:hypothetical protein
VVLLFKLKSEKILILEYNMFNINILRDLAITNIPFIMSSYCKRGGLAHEDFCVVPERHIS